MISEICKALVLSLWIAIKRPGAAAVDITNRCNLRCKHCYWWEQDHPQELDDRDMVQLFRRLKTQGMRAAILYGGEPALRLDVCRAATEIFDGVLVFTNGTLGLPELGSGQWIVSLDGSKEVNDKIRGQGVFDSAVESIKRAPIPPIVHMTISRLNAACLEDFVREMLELPIKGMGFSFFTPIRGLDQQDLIIPIEERKGVAKRLLALREKYGERVGFTRAMARQVLADGSFSSWNSYERCPVSKGLQCYRADGTRKLCTYGDDADCSQCGCAAVAVYRGALYPPNYETMRLILGLTSPGFLPKR